MWVNTLTGERFMLFDLVIAFFKFYTMRVFFLCVLQLQFYKKKKYTLNIDSTSVVTFTTLGRIQLENEDAYVCKSKATVYMYILVYLSMLTIINILFWDKADLGAFLVNWSCLIQNHTWIHEMSFSKKEEAMTEMMWLFISKYEL